MLFYCNSVHGYYITTKFCICHDSSAVVACAKFCSDQFIRIWIMVKWNFHWIWIMMLWRIASEMGSWMGFTWTVIMGLSAMESYQIWLLGGMEDTLCWSAPHICPGAYIMRVADVVGTRASATLTGLCDYDGLLMLLVPGHQQHWLAYVNMMVADAVGTRASATLTGLCDYDGLLMLLVPGHQQHLLAYVIMMVCWCCWYQGISNTDWPMRLWWFADAVGTRASATLNGLCDYDGLLMLLVPGHQQHWLAYEIMMVCWCCWYQGISNTDWPMWLRSMVADAVGTRASATLVGLCHQESYYATYLSHYSQCTVKTALWGINSLAPGRFEWNAS